MSRSDPRQAKPLSSATDDPAGAEAGGTPSALLDLLEEVRSPALVRSDVDLLIAALGRGPGPDEPPRVRADLLLGLMAHDNPVGDYVGRNGKTVRHAARDALLGLGFPYALEVPPELMEPAAPPRPPRTGIGKAGVFALVALALSQTGILAWQVVSSQMDKGYNPRPIWYTPSEFALLGAFIWLPPLVSLCGHVLKRRWLQGIGWLLIAAQALPWLLLAYSAVSHHRPDYLRAISKPWFLSLWALWATRPLPKPPPRTEEVPPPTP
ncbi:hypothetical protein [Corallococcus terminator]|uniref:Uncharacterized protein n=1 Tax=Corallococcus terminator TaxID=2316733 RepID=A0A3A8HQ07_9BACT|nr:hypothetical protein [Corallococcus terminator]RKG67971.1 hypothetical protein D7V88_40875 [Corallococcus terminator]